MHQITIVSGPNQRIYQVVSGKRQRGGETTSEHSYVVGLRNGVRSGLPCCVSATFSSVKQYLFFGLLEEEYSECTLFFRLPVPRFHETLLLTTTLRTESFRLLQLYRLHTFVRTYVSTIGTLLTSHACL